MLTPMRHMVFVRPFYSDKLVYGTLELEYPDSYIDKHEQSGKVVAIGDLDQDDIAVGDVVMFVGWKASVVNLETYEQYREKIYSLHENDIEAILEDW